MNIPANAIPARLHDLMQRVIDEPSIRGVVVLVLPSGEDADVEVFGFGEAVEEGAAVDRMLDLAKQVIRAA